MDKENGVAVNTPKILRVNGKQATLRRARKVHKCTECGLLIEPGKFYYEVILTGGSGVGGFLYPDHVHDQCIDNYLNIGGGNGRW